MAIIDDLINRTINGEDNSDQHTMSIFGIAVGIKAQNILELGVFEGNTSQPLAFAASLTGGHVTSVDNYLRAQNFPSELDPYRTTVQSDSIKFLKQAAQEGKKYDLIYIDDWHEYSHVKEELSLIDQLITNKSIILLHDLMAFTYPVYHQPLDAKKGTEWGEGGPTRAVFELNKDHWEWSTIPVNNGLTILRRI
jgi:predicted O-methyltransferase YrrM